MTTFEVKFSRHRLTIRWSEGKLFARLDSTLVSSPPRVKFDDPTSTWALVSSLF
jgi:hypothetical protein